MPEKKSLARRILLAAGSLLLLFAILFTINSLMGATSISEEVKEERIAVTIYDNQTGEESLDVLGNYLSHNLHRKFSELNVTITSPSTVEDHLHTLGILPGNPEDNLSFYELTEVRYTIEGSYFKAPNGDIEVSINIVDKINGATVFSFKEPFNGSEQDIQGLSEEIGNSVLGYWTMREEVKKGKFDPPKYEAFLEYQRAEDIWYRI